MECAKSPVKATFNQNRALNNGTVSKQKHAQARKVYRGIFAYVIVYIFAHLHTALLVEGNMLEIN